MRILIIAHFYPPRNSMAAHRPYSWAKYWTRLGHDVTVLTSAKAASFDDLTFDTTFCNVIEVPWLPSWLGDFTRRSDGNIDSQTSREPSASKHLLSRLASVFAKLVGPIQRKYGIFYAIRFPDVFMLWRWNSMKALTQMDKWDVVVSTNGPYATHLIAHKLKKQGLALRWIADYRDLWVGNFPYPGIWPLNVYERVLERKILRIADAATTANESFSNKLARMHNNLPIHTIENGFEPADIETLTTAKYFPNDGIFRIVYTGWMHGLRDPSALFTAIAALHDELNTSSDAVQKLDLEVVFVGPFSAFVEERAVALNVAMYVKQAGMVSRSESLQIQRDAHVLFFMEWKSNGESIFSGKIFEYLSSGTEIWATGGPLDTSVRELIAQSRTGIHFGDDTEAIVRVLRERLTTKKKLILDPDVSYLHSFTRESKANAYIKIIEDVASSR